MPDSRAATWAAPTAQPARLLDKFQGTSTGQETPSLWQGGWGRFTE